MEENRWENNNILKSIPANLSPFGEIHRFEIKIGHPRESCRSEVFSYQRVNHTDNLIITILDKYTSIVFMVYCFYGIVSNSGILIFMAGII